MGECTSADHVIDALKGIYEIMHLLEGKYTEGLVDQIFLDIFEIKVFKIRSMSKSSMKSRFLHQKSYFNTLFNLVFSGKLHF